jgi:phosphatidylglycerophosphate synthase
MNRNVPNAISLARLASAPFLLATAITGHRDGFRWLLLACLVSDIADGWIARAFHLRSPLGARLDSIADMLVEIGALCGVWMFHADVVREHALLVGCALGLYLGQIGLALWRYGRVSSFHTVLNRIAAYAQGIFLITLFFWGFSALFFYAVILLVIVSASEEIVLVCILPQWTADVGGLWRMRARKRTAT